jgi:hypothetical protein
MTYEVGSLLRAFKNHVCPKFTTEETPTEAEARKRREARRQKKQPAYHTSYQRRRRTTRKFFNLSTYKIHALGHYPYCIRRFGTTDNYSTQRVSQFFSYTFSMLTPCLQGEFEHRRLKRLYRNRTNKRRATRQLGKHIHRIRHLKKIDDRNMKDRNPTPAEGDDEELPVSSPELPYNVSQNSRHRVSLPVWLGENRDDPALKVCC